jgi:hypothetical protein
MGEPALPRSHDQGIPPATGDDMGTREPLGPLPLPEPHERRPLPEEETYERNQERKGPDGQPMRSAGSFLGGRQTVCEAQGMGCRTVSK